jgi:hypothetical protein
MLRPKQHTVNHVMKDAVHYAKGKVCMDCGYSTSYERIVYKVDGRRVCYCCAFGVIPPSDPVARATIELISRAPTEEPRN